MKIAYVTCEMKLEDYARRLAEYAKSIPEGCLVIYSKKEIGYV